RELERLQDNPKLFHQVHSVNAMNQAHYQRHALAVGKAFAHEAAERIERLVEHHGAHAVVLTGETRAVARLRHELSPHVMNLLVTQPRSLEPDAPSSEIWHRVAPLIAQVKTERHQSILDQLVEGVRSTGLGVVGLEAVHRGLRLGQVDILVLMEDASLAAERQDELIAWASKTDATIQVVEQSDLLERLGGVGALLRYPMAVHEA
ncbi:MAG TPA: host attachment protein, partial [Ktedonobacterales bacterium]